MYKVPNKNTKEQWVIRACRKVHSAFEISAMSWRLRNSLLGRRKEKEKKEKPSLLQSRAKNQPDRAVWEVFFILPASSSPWGGGMVEGQQEFEAGQGCGGIPCLTLLCARGRQMACEWRAPAYACAQCLCPAASVLLQSFWSGSGLAHTSILQKFDSRHFAGFMHLHFVTWLLFSPRDIPEHPSGKHNSQSFEAILI